MGIFAYDVYNKDNELLGEHEIICKWNEAKDEIELVDDDTGAILIGKKKLSIIAKTAGNWSGHGWYEPGLGTWVDNSKHRDRLAAERGLVAQDDASSNKHFVKDLWEKKAASNAHWDKRHQEFFDIKDREMRNGRSEQQAELQASIEWGSEDKLKEDQRFINKKVAERKLPSNISVR